MKKLALLVISGALFGPVAVFYLLCVFVLIWALRKPKNGTNQYINKYKLI